MTLESVLKVFLENFSLTMLLIALIFVLIHWVFYRKRISIYEMLYRWIALFAVGVSGIYAAFLHAFYPELTAANIGWPASPQFQWEVAMADFAIGLLAILSFRASYPFRLATVIATACLLWGDAIGHIWQMIQFQNFAPGNAGSWFWTDVFVPLILVICIIKLNPKVKS